MKLEFNSDLWRAIYYNLRDEFYSLNRNGAASRDHIRLFLEDYGIKIKTDPNWGTWEDVEITLDNDELTLFMLRWS